MNDEMDYRCNYCHRVFKTFSEVIDHNVISHGDVCLKFQKRVWNGSDDTAFCWQTKGSSIIPNDVKKQGCFITPESASNTIRVSDMGKSDETFLKSPVRKKTKLDASKHDQNVSDLPSDLNDLSLETPCSIGNRNEENENESAIQELHELIPEVLRNLKDKNQIDIYMKFNRLVAEKRFPLTNIAYLLFLDVVNWFSNDSTTQMRYDEDVKRFWRIGLKLFKGKFLMFMGGLKNSGQSVTDGVRHGTYNPSMSKINFAVPSRQVLDELQSPVSVGTPGIITEMIDDINRYDHTQTESYKLCVDGKKINAGLLGQKLGDVNLWGFEQPPTLTEKKIQLQIDIEILEKLKDSVIKKVELKDVDKISDVTDVDRSMLLHESRDCLEVFSKRINELRVSEVGRKIALEKLIKQVTGDWRSSRLGFAISGLRTYIYDVNACLVDMLGVINRFGIAVASLTESNSLYPPSDMVHLGLQGNYLCLQGIRDPIPSIPVNDNKTLSIVNQRSDAWFSVRRKAVVTGSTLYRALGFEGLKLQQAHFRAVFHNEQEESPNPELLKIMEHGTVNEINAVATLVSKVLPVYYPNMYFTEEGCNSMSNVSSGIFIVSPDGSLRHMNDGLLSEPVFGIEIKCPYPGKVYTTAVHYKIPVRYVPQILCEMAVLNVQSLLYLSYSEQSTVALVAEFDKDLWDKLGKVTTDLYPIANAAYPKKIHPDIKGLRKDIEAYTVKKVKKLCEVPSVKAIQCTHDESTFAEPQHRTHGKTVSRTEIRTSEFQQAIHKAIDCVNHAYHLSRTKASEVLVFVLANLDRIQKHEVKHAVPVAYAFKGYSMKTDTMRQMIRCVLEECHTRGLYTPVVAFDGQWYNIAVRDASGKPLTLLQLQKDVYAESKKETKSALVKHMCSSNVLQERNLDGIASKAYIRIETDDNGNFTGPIEIGKLFSGKAYRPSKHIYDILRRESQSSKSEKSQTRGSYDDEPSNVVDSADSDYILNALPDTVLSALDTDTLAEIKRIQVSIKDQINGLERNVNLDGIPNLFLDDEDHVTVEDNVIQLRSTGQLEREIPIPILEQEQVLNENDFSCMHQRLKESIDASKWNNCTLELFMEYFKSAKLMNEKFKKRELQICLRAVSEKLKEKNVHHACSWPKYRISSLFDEVLNSKESNVENFKRSSAKSLKWLCRRAVSNIPKADLNAIYAEHIFPDRFVAWKRESPFFNGMLIKGVADAIHWYCKPEFIQQTYIHQFTFLDPHHLFTNARVKCCNTGIAERGISRDAWIQVAKDGHSGLNIALVEDLVDKQSDSFAKATFSDQVEKCMLQKGFINEAKFCKLIREWYEAEDNPGIDVVERCNRRLNLRNWLLRGVQFNRFPPPGSHILGIPQVMFEGLMTNIDRRIQLFPFVKKRNYNVRSLGSLEAENLFGAFQDLDPKGSGVIRPDDIPAALGSACELLSARMDNNKPFVIHTSRSKVYPAHSVINEDARSDRRVFIYPEFVNTVEPLNHDFDMPERAYRRQKKRSGTISTYSACSRAPEGVRKYHKCKEENIHSDVRANIKFQ